MSEIKLQIGKKYKLRNGLVTSPLEKHDNLTNYKFEAEVKDPRHTIPHRMCWTESGAFLSNCAINRYDIVEELDLES